MSADLSLVTECLRGDPLAWETLVLRYRARVFQFALKLARDECAAQEVASAVWADLYGVRTDGNGTRLSKLAGYSGRGSLEGWLRALVAQEYVDRFRKERRFVPFEERETGWNAGSGGAVQVSDVRLETALDKALSELSGEQRLVLAAHYLDGRTFAEIGRMLGTHESSVSRQSKKSLEFVRKRTARHLRAAGMSLQEAREAMGCDVRSISLDLRRRLQLAKDIS
jgi:RNA polymerase sigma-70 factor (ECF subfamily)